MDPFSATITVGVVILALTNFVKFFIAGIRGQGWNGAVTMFVAFVIAFFTLWLFGGTVWADQITIGNYTLNGLSIADKLPVAIAAASVGSVIYDLLNSFDRSSSAAKPPLTGYSTEQLPGPSSPSSQPGTHV